MSVAPSPLSFRDFRLYWVARFTMIMAQNAMVIIIGWQVYDIARGTLGMSERAAAFQLGLIGVAQFAPLLLLTLFSGWVADRLDRRWVARAAIALDLACALALALMTASGHITLPALFGIAVLLGVARAFAGPAMSPLAANLVPPESLPRAIAMSSIAWQTGAIVGPALGGYLYATDAPAPYWASASLFAVALIAMTLIRPVPRKALNADDGPWTQMIEGLRYTRKNRILLGAISLDLFAVLFGGATALLPVYARDILHTGPEGLGHLRAAPAVGAALTALWFAWRPLEREVGVRMFLAVGLFGLATIVFGFSRVEWLSLAALATLGAGDMISVYVRSSLIQLHTPDAMRGRVSAVSLVFISGSNELGEAQSGVAAALIGPVAAVVTGGIGAILVTALWAKWFPELRNARSFAPPPALDDLQLRETPA